MISQASARIAKLFDGSEAEMAEEPVVEGYPLYLAHWMLQNSGVVAAAPEGYRLQREIAAGEVIMEASPENMPEVPLPDTAGMGRKMHFSLRPIWVVVADPVIHFVCEPDEVADILEELADEDTCLAVAENLSGKQLNISSLIEVVRNQPGVSLDGLAGRLSGMSTGEEENSVPFDILLDRETLGLLVSELRKQSILAGNDRKIRPASKGISQKKRH